LRTPHYFLGERTSIATTFQKKVWGSSSIFHLVIVENSIWPLERGNFLHFGLFMEFGLTWGEKNGKTDGFMTRVHVYSRFGALCMKFTVQVGWLFLDVAF
jgi:hypothetical protein